MNVSNENYPKNMLNLGGIMAIIGGLGRTILSISGGLFHSFVAWMIGLPFILMGIAVTKNNHYHSWLGWIAIFLGSGVLIAGTTRFLGFDLIPYPALYGGFIIPLTLWLVGLGCFMWLKSRTGIQEIETRN